MTPEDAPGEVLLANVRAAADRLTAVIANFQGRSTPLNSEQEDVLLLCRYAHASTDFHGFVPREQPCDWCGRAIRRDGEKWLAVKVAGRSSALAHCPDNHDGTHEPQGSTT